MKRSVTIYLTPRLSMDDMNGVLNLGVDVTLHGDARITVPTDDQRAEVWLRGRGYTWKAAEPQAARQLPVTPVLRSAE